MQSDLAQSFEKKAGLKTFLNILNIGVILIKGAETLFREKM